jgi:hypothetical protein
MATFVDQWVKRVYEVNGQALDTSWAGWPGLELESGLLTLQYPLTTGSANASSVLPSEMTGHEKK